jgi:hypothetical protein
MSANDDNPVKGKGEEMVPERGLPFEEDNSAEDPTMMSALSEDELSQLEADLGADHSQATVEVADEDAAEIRSLPELTPSEAQEILPEESTTSEKTTVPDATSLHEVEARVDEIAIESHVATAESDEAPVQGSLFNRGPVEIDEEEILRMKLATGEISGKPDDVLVEPTPHPALGDDEVPTEEIPPKMLFDEDPKPGVLHLSEAEMAELDGIPDPEIEAKLLADLKNDSEAPPTDETLSVEGLADAVLGSQPATPGLPASGPPELGDGGMRAGMEPEDLPGPGSEPAVQPFFTDSAVFEPPDPIGKPEGSSLPAIAGDIAANKKLLSMMVTQDRIQELWERADLAVESINNHIHSLPIARQLLNQVRSGKTLLLSGPENFEEAERAINEVEFRVIYAGKVRTWSGKQAMQILYYLIGFLVILGLGAFFLPSLFRNIINGNSALFAMSFPDFIRGDDIFNAIGAMMWGGLGGVVGALYSLWRHVSEEQDFSPQYRMWYYTQPIMGIPIGAFIFLFINIGLKVTVGSPDINVNSPFVIYILAWVAGFQQNVVYSIVREILKLFRMERKSENS